MNASAKVTDARPLLPLVDILQILAASGASSWELHPLDLADVVDPLQWFAQRTGIVAALGQDLDTILASEEEPGLGNGGLGRLAACYLDSLATLERPAIGYGIRYEFGIFDQQIHDGWQVEKPDNWLVNGNPWEIPTPDLSYQVNWGGHTERYVDEAAHQRVRWVPRRMF